MLNRARVVALCDELVHVLDEVRGDGLASRVGEDGRFVKHHAGDAGRLIGRLQRQRDAR
jgi:hypothetical protein